MKRGRNICKRNTGEEESDGTKLGEKKNPNTKVKNENISSLCQDKKKELSGERGQSLAPLCDSSGGSCCNGSNLGAGFNSNSGGRGNRNRLGSRLNFVLAFPRDVAGLRALVANLAGGAQRATVGSSAVTGNVTLNMVNYAIQDGHHMKQDILTSFPQA